MSRPPRGQDVLAIAPQAIASATTIEQLRDKHRQWSCPFNTA
ncbi:hypothetical protein [Candidatus Nitrotoga sp. AM1P]|nr:hypothetical protein [Candidatus Nitrotoga sp. AM1P]